MDSQNLLLLALFYSTAIKMSGKDLIFKNPSVKNVSKYASVMEIFYHHTDKINENIHFL